MDTIFTIGHSTRSAEQFLELLRANGIRRLVDIRRFPGSRRYPHFAKEQMAEWLPAAGVDYIHHVELGGRRKGRDDSPHVFWQNESFRSYADYMDTAEFREALEQLMIEARQQPTAIMCSEAVPWRCHRRLVADALVVHGFDVQDIMDGGTRPHVLNPHARAIDADRLVYDRIDPSQAKLFD
jgi:uncharacterized protein (DUF488 family)